MNKICNYMGAATRRFPVLLNATNENVVDGVNEDVGIPYSSPAQQ
jgi:hypothetical protein